MSAAVMEDNDFILFTCIVFIISVFAVIVFCSLPCCAKCVSLLYKRICARKHRIGVTNNNSSEQTSVVHTAVAVGLRPPPPCYIMASTRPQNQSVPPNSIFSIREDYPVYIRSSSVENPPPSYDSLFPIKGTEDASDLSPNGESNVNSDSFLTTQAEMHPQPVPKIEYTYQSDMLFTKITMD